MTYQIMYCKDLDQETISVTIIDADSIGAAVQALCTKLGITEANVLAVLLVNE